MNPMTMAVNLINPVDEAKRAIIFMQNMFVGVMEKGSNRGPEVEMFQRAAGGSVGDNWCMEAQMWFVRRIAAVYRLTVRMHMSPSCQQTWDNTDDDYKVDRPEVGAVVIWLDGDGTGHTGLVTGVYEDGRFTTIEGNAHGEKGDGFYRLTHTMKPKGSRKVAGFIRPFG